jgi:hypothetical protein
MKTLNTPTPAAAISRELDEHMKIATGRLTAIAKKNLNQYTTVAFESCWNAALYDLIFGSESLKMAPAGLTDRELLFARAILKKSFEHNPLRLSTEGVKLIRTTAADFARRLAAVHVTQDAFALDAVAGAGVAA